MGGDGGILNNNIKPHVDNLDIYKLNLNTMTWSEVKSNNIPPIIRRGNTCSLLGNRVLVYGGVNAVKMNDAYWFDLNTLLWSRAGKNHLKLFLLLLLNSLKLL